MDSPQELVVTVSPPKMTLVPPLMLTDSESGGGTSEAQLTTSPVGQTNVGGAIRLSVAQLVTVLQKPLISTQYCPSSPVEALVIVMEFVVAQLSSSPSFRQTKAKGPSPSGCVVKEATAFEHTICSVNGELVAKA